MKSSPLFNAVLSFQIMFAPTLSFASDFASGLASSFANDQTPTSNVDANITDSVPGHKVAQREPASDDKVQASSKTDIDEAYLIASTVQRITGGHLRVLDSKQKPIDSKQVFKDEAGFYLAPADKDSKVMLGFRSDFDQDGKLSVVISVIADGRVVNGRKLAIEVGADGFSDDAAKKNALLIQTTARTLAAQLEKSGFAQTGHAPTGRTPAASYAPTALMYMTGIGIATAVIGAFAFRVHADVDSKPHLRIAKAGGRAAVVGFVVAIASLVALSFQKEERD